MVQTHHTHPKTIARLKRAQGHLSKVISMMEEQAPCTDIAQQLHAVEKAIIKAKRVLIHDHIDHCLTPDSNANLSDLKNISKYL